MNLNKEIKLNKKVIVFILMIYVVILCSYYSYALFQVSILKNDVVVLSSATALPSITTTIGDTNSDTFTLPASDSVEITVNLSTTGVSSALAYKMYYNITNNYGSFRVSSSDTFPGNKVEGTFTETKSLVLTFTNNSSTALTIKLGAIAGYEKTGAILTGQNELILNSDLVQKTYQTIVNKMNNGGSGYIKNYTTEIIANNPTYTTQDTYDTNNNKYDVYYFTGSDAKANGNVLFAGYCWQIIRTTDTGGLKLLYNGPAAADGSGIDKCAPSGRTALNGKGVIGRDGASVSLSATTSSTMYGTSYSYDLTNDTFTLTGTTFTNKPWNDTNYKDLIGKYTCLNSSDAFTETGNDCKTLYYIGDYISSTTAYVARYTIGTNDYYYQLGTSAYNTNYSSPANVGYMYNKVINYKSISAKSNSYYGNYVTYSNETYTLHDTTAAVASAPTAGKQYVCDNSTGTTCTKVRFYYFNNYYVLLEGGDTDPLYSMFNVKMQTDVHPEQLTTDVDINVYHSAIKGYVDTWYKQNIDNLESVNELVDTSAVYCNDRSSSNNYGSWNKDATSLSTLLYFKHESSNQDLNCIREEDRFTAESGNTKAKLTYPVGLLTESERNLMQASYAASGYHYWGSSPGSFLGNRADVRIVAASGDTSNYVVDGAHGVRPAVSLRPDAEISEGEGTPASPYVIGPKITR